MHWLRIPYDILLQLSAVSRRPALPGSLAVSGTTRVKLRGMCQRAFPVWNFDTALIFAIGCHGHFRKGPADQGSSSSSVRLSPLSGCFSCWTVLRSEKQNKIRFIRWHCFVSRTANPLGPARPDLAAAPRPAEKLHIAYIALHAGQRRGRRACLGFALEMLLLVGEHSAKMSC